MTTATAPAPKNQKKGNEPESNEGGETTAKSGRGKKARNKIEISVNTPENIVTYIGQWEEVVEDNQPTATFNNHGFSSNKILEIEPEGKGRIAAVALHGLALDIANGNQDALNILNAMTAFAKDAIANATKSKTESLLIQLQKLTKGTLNREQLLKMISEKMKS